MWLYKYNYFNMLLDLVYDVAHIIREPLAAVNAWICLGGTSQGLCAGWAAGRS